MYCGYSDLKLNYDRCVKTHYKQRHVNNSKIIKIIVSLYITHILIFSIYQLKITPDKPLRSVSEI